jgi:hypothetical protein
MRCRAVGSGGRAYAVNMITLNREEDDMTRNEEQRDRQVELEMARLYGRADADQPVPVRSTEVWNQVGMLDEEIGRICKSIDALCDLLEAAGVLEPLHEVGVGRGEVIGEEPTSCVRLGKSLQDMRHVLDRYNECVCVATSRLGV